MKHFLPFIAILGLCLACAPPNKLASIGKKQDSIQKEKKIHIEKQIAPGTCSLNLKNCEIISEDENQWITGEISSIKAYGAGFTSTFEKGQKIKIGITEKQANHLNSEQTLSCLISNIDALRKKPFLKLVEYQLPIKN